MKRTIVILVIVTVVAMVYAFLKQVEATKNIEEAVRQKNLAVQSEQRAMVAEEESRRQQTIASEQAAVAAQVMEQMSKCCKGKK